MVPSDILSDEWLPSNHEYWVNDTDFEIVFRRHAGRKLFSGGIRWNCSVYHLNFIVNVCGRFAVLAVLQCKVLVV